VARLARGGETALNQRLVRTRNDLVRARHELVVGGAGPLRVFPGLPEDQA
jgi:hypothetical protein